MTLDLDITYVVVLVLLLLPLLILNGIVIQPFLRLFEERHQKLEGNVERAEQLLSEAKAQAEQFEIKIREATHRGVEARAMMRKEATDRMNARIEEERQQAQQRLNESLEHLDTEREKAMTESATQADAIANLIASKLLGRTI